MKRDLCWIIVVLVAIAILVCGCQEEQKTQVWGEGELPVKWREWFGDDNGSRLDFVQVETINKQVQDVKNLATRIDKLEALNSDQHKKLGETDIRFHKRINDIVAGLDKHVTSTENRVKTLTALQEVAAGQIGETIALLGELAERTKALEERTTGWRSPESIAKEMLGDAAILDFTDE